MHDIFHSFIIFYKAQQLLLRYKTISNPGTSRSSKNQVIRFSADDVGVMRVAIGVGALLLRRERVLSWSVAMCGRSMGLWKNTDGSVASRHLGLDLVCFGIVDDQNCPHQKQPLKWRPKFSTPTPMQCTQQSLLSECLPQCLRNESLVFLRIDIYDMLSLDVIGCALGFRFWTWTPRFN